MHLKAHSILLIFLLLQAPLVTAQEWKSLKAYQKETGQATLQEGCWLKKDRTRKTEVWKKANVFNLSVDNGNLKYTTLSEMRDFYHWFDQEIKKQGHEIKWIGIAEIVANQLSNLDYGFVRVVVVRNKEVVDFANEGCARVLAFAFPKLKEVYFSSEILKGKVAEDWDNAYGRDEQCAVLEPLYKKLSPKALCKLDRMAKGKGVYTFAVSKEMKYQGSIEDCETRFLHGRDRIALQLKE
ncbi:hypothetical protein FSS13T_18870 [Flavobacterium saliperosum S13]|uniref:Uncharacterized protein n=2 Tax=Flavobacterium saliperosum TaxID=329186 RepID=A0A1G4W7W6_9FLAO|nr:hypothetical protein [Flavobacterium saliperosum]ESU24989.1 hypothetical protein FSS13T_18870 [Flavobacterium saliperosum S13]SCX18238.1 hypothetical protein SAMN02927925_02648 [Flavobacterium saliperosum]